MNYNPILPFKSAHFNTLFRKLFVDYTVNFDRVRIDTPDSDFIDIDFSRVDSKKVILIVHGLEGSSNSKYVLSNTLYFNKKGYDVCAINLRGCSGEPNLLYVSYHSGKTDDLDLVVRYLEDKYSEIIIVGYSLGGNISLKYAGESGSSINSKISKVIGVSVPVDLKSSSIELAKKNNYIYNNAFMVELKEKLRYKVKKFNIDISEKQISSIKSFNDFDGIYTSVAHGFKDAEDYWKKSSSKQFIPEIKVPSLLINAKDDTFLGENCYPIKEAQENPFFNIYAPKYGGHVGFNNSFNKSKNFWIEENVLEFINQ